MQLVSFIPQTAAYQVWYPPHFIIEESDDDVVSIVSPETNACLTLSSYTVNQQVTEEIITAYLEQVTAAYNPVSAIGSVIAGERIWLEKECRNEKAYWLWWAIGQADKLILASVNSATKLSDADRHLFTFIIDKLEIYPD